MAGMGGSKCRQLYLNNNKTIKKMNSGNYYRESIILLASGESQNSQDHLRRMDTFCFVKMHLIGRI